MEKNERRMKQRIPRRRIKVRRHHQAAREDKEQAWMPTMMYSLTNQIICNDVSHWLLYVILRRDRNHRRGKIWEVRGHSGQTKRCACQKTRDLTWANNPHWRRWQKDWCQQGAVYLIRKRQERHLGIHHVILWSLTSVLLHILRWLQS